MSNEKLGVEQTWTSYIIKVDLGMRIGTRGGGLGMRLAIVSTTQRRAEIFKGYFQLIVRRTCKHVNRIYLFLSIAAAVVLVLAVLFAVSGTILIICSVILACMCFRRRKTKYKTLMQDAQLSFAESKEPIPDLEPSV